MCMKKRKSQTCGPTIAPTLANTTNHLKILPNTTIKNNNTKLIFYNFKQYKNRKAFRTLFSVTCSLIIFWLPWIILWPIDAYCQCLPRIVYIIIYFMEYLNSLINSVFIVFGNQHFRRKFLNFKKCIFWN